MPEVRVSSVSLVSGERLEVTLSGFPLEDYPQVQIDVFSAGVPNPSSRIGIGTTPDLSQNGLATVTFDTGSLAVGYYEIGPVRLLKPDGEEIADVRVFAPAHDFARCVFEIRDPDHQPKDASLILAEIESLEEEVIRRFTEPVDLTGVREGETFRYGALVFIRDVLLVVGMRFDHFEIVPTMSGLEGADELTFVNTFLAQSGLAIRFEQDDEAKARQRQNNPVSVLHFPAMDASSPEVVRDYCARETETLLLALALSRDAGGVPFDIVVVNMITREALKFGSQTPYVGNLITGSMAGENADQVQRYMDGIAADEMNRFLVGLYREARRDRSYDFQYVRLWQILETMADSRNYDPEAPLLDFHGKRMQVNGQAARIKGSVNTVFTLLKEGHLGGTDEAWRKANVWFAFRSAVVHCGSVSRFSELSRNSTREWARVAWEEIQSSGHDRYVMALKDDTKLLLMQRLVGSSQ